MSESNFIKQKAFSSVVWKFLERIMAQLVSLVVSVTLARLLSPDDYSTVSVVAIFFAFANVIISGGLNTALIQKKNADKVDYSTVLYTSVLISLLIYGILFFCAPYIAILYHKEELVSIVRVMGLSLPIYAIKSILCAYISANLQFKKFFFATIGGTLASAVVGIYMAIHGFGAWALVGQQITNTIIDTLILLLTTRMPIGIVISFTRLKELFGYGWKVLVSSLLSSAYMEAVPLFVGIKFSATDLSFYTKGKSFPSLISSTTTSTLSAVLFPVLAKYQDDKDALLRHTRNFIRVASFVAFPLMLGLFAVSENFVKVILTEKWLDAVFYIRVFCIVSMFEMIHMGNCETIKAMGRSDIFLIMEIIKKSSYFVIIAVFIFFGKTPEALAISSIVCTLVALIVNAIPNMKLIGYNFKNQIIDVLPNLVIALIMCVVVVLIGMISINMYLSLIIQIVSGAVCYLLLSIFSKNQSMGYILEVLKNRKEGRA